MVASAFPAHWFAFYDRGYYGFFAGSFARGLVIFHDSMYRNIPSHSQQQ
jgi:hypothetical protein